MVHAGKEFANADLAGQAVSLVCWMLNLHRYTIVTWGGSVTFATEDGQYHVFFPALMKNHCGLNSWIPHSAIYHAISSTDSPMGPNVNERKCMRQTAFFGVAY
jgi:hypothetical protein